MKRLYYFSKNTLKYEEIKNFKRKTIAFLGSSLFLILILLSGIFFISTFFFSRGDNYIELKRENRSLKDKIIEISDLYKTLNKQLDSLITVNRDLRIAANLPPITEEEGKVGVGGSYFDNTLDFNFKNNNLKSVFNEIEEISRKVQFERDNYLEISRKLSENKILFESIPAIKPCTGTVADGFGMRLHPILNVNRMHDGIDIITDIGTPVVSAGKGIVEFIGEKGGYGLAIEIDHGSGYKSVYAHLSSIMVKVGQKVKRGETIAKTGNSGLSTGPHLHYEISHNGIKENPVNFFFDDVNLFNTEKK